MSFIEAPTNFYLGKEYDPQQRKLTENVVYYDSRDLTTHAVVVGMTGSGKTGLCIDLLEEAILDNIPAIIIDPKGDICNLALTFPEQRPEDFAPWINPDAYKRTDMTQAEYAADVAQTWREGLRTWDIVPDRLKWLKAASKLTIYTPGSDSGLPISILASLRAPRIEWAGSEEIIRDRISGVVTALFTLAGKDVQPLQDVEHVLVSNILEYNWRQGRDLTLEDIILQIKQPPFERLGAFDVNQYFPEKARYKLAIEFNNIIAAPTFQSWISGEPLDMQSLLYQPNGRPRVSVFYTAHLSDQERMFITTLLLESLIAWMRTQQGTTSLRALLYIDEMYGYFPPYPKNPPTKQPIMRLLKQARAFGVGLVLATQNPGDLDYKGLSNAGTWFIGRLNSDNDRQRVMEGLQSLASMSDGEYSLSAVEQLIADVPRRVFLMRNVHQEGPPVLVHSRWAMNYLAGPMTRIQITQLMDEQKRAAYNAAQYTSGWGVSPAPSAPVLPPPGASYAPPPPPEMPTAPPGIQPPPPPPMLFGAQTAPSYGEYTPPPTGAYPPVGGNTGAMPAVRDTTGQMQTIGGNTGLAPAMGDSQVLRPQLAGVGGSGGLVTTRPPLPSDIQQYFLPATLSSQVAFNNARVPLPSGNILLAYIPSLFAQVQVRYNHRPSQIYFMREYAYHVPDVPANGLVVWENYQAAVVDQRMISDQPFGQAVFQQPPTSLTNAKRLKDLQRELLDMVAATARLTVLYHPLFKIYADPNRDPSEFYAQIQQIAREKADAEGDKLTQKYGQMYDKLEDRRQNQSMAIEANRQELKDRKREHTFTTGEAVLSIFRGRTNYTLSRMSRAGRMSRQTEFDIEQNREQLGDLARQMQDLEVEFRNVMQQTMDKWAKTAQLGEEFSITPYKKDVAVSLFGLGWIPHYYVQTNGQPILVAAFG